MKWISFQVNAQLLTKKDLLTSPLFVMKSARQDLFLAISLELIEKPPFPCTRIEKVIQLHHKLEAFCKSCLPGGFLVKM